MTHDLAADFRNLESIPADPQDVIWPDLEPSFHRRCIASLAALTEVCKLVVDDPAAAVQEMVDSVRIAQVISQSHYDLAMKRAKELINRIHDGTLRASLLSALSPGGQQGESLADTHG